MRAAIKNQNNSSSRTNAITTDTPFLEELRKLGHNNKTKPAVTTTRSSDFENKNRMDKNSSIF